MISAFIALGVTLVVFVVLDCLGYKVVKPEKEIPSYISDMERELSTARKEQEVSIDNLRTEISRVIAKELPKAVKSGKSSVDIELNLAGSEYSSSEGSLTITPSQLNLLKLHSMHDRWSKKNLIDPNVSKYISDVRLYVSSFGVDEYAMLTVWVLYQEAD